MVYVSSRLVRISLGIVVALFVAGGWYVYLRPQDAATAAPSAAVATVVRGDLALAVSATGTLSPLITVQVGSQVSGTIEQVYADFNSQVRKGDVIAQIEPSLFKAKVAEEQANFDSAQAARDKAWVAVQDAQRQLQRARRLHKSNMMAESEVDAAQYAYDAAVVEHRLRTATVAQARAALEHAQVNLDHTTIHAPIDGVVLSRDVDVGQTVAASLQAPTLFTIAKDLRRMQIETDVDEAFIGMIELGQNVSFTVFAYPKRIFSGKLLQIRLNPRVESEVVLYNCIIEVDNADLALKPGMTATVTIDVEHRENVLKVPNAALRYLPDRPPEQLKKLRKALNLEADEAILWTADDAGIRPVRVRLGLTSDRETEISGDDIAEGMRVAVPGERKAPPTKRKTGVRLF